MPNQRLERFAHISEIATALIAIFALVIAIWQIKVAESVQQEASAREAFKEYLKLAVDKPELADARLAATDGSETARSRYAWFVTYFLYSAEQIYESYPDDPAWQHSLAEEICYHQRYLSAQNQQDIQDQHGTEFATFMEESLQNCPPEPPQE